ncbi:MAG: alpha/beta fold hydrolase [Alphaproteobacteria bacterium]
MSHTVAFFPGLLCDETLFDAQTTAFDAAGYDTYVADFSAAHHDSFEAMIIDVLADLPDRFSLVGLSMGGYAALKVIELAGQRVERLALLDTNARADAPETSARRRGLLDLAAKGDFKGVTPRLLPLYIHESRLTDTPLTEAVTGMAERLGPDVFRRQQTAILERKDQRETLAAFEAPVLVICGREDQVTPLFLSEEMAALAPKGDLLVIEECGHLSTMERPDEVSDALLHWVQG